MHWQTGCSIGARYAIRIDLLRIDLLTEATRTERNVVFVSGQMSKLPSACFYFYLFASHKFFEILHTWKRVQILQILHGGGYKYCKYCSNWQFCKYPPLPNLISEWCTQLCDKQKSLRKLWPNCFGQVSFKSCPSVPKIFQSY